MLREWQDPEAIVQQALARGVAAARRFDPSRQPEVWLGQIFSRLCYDACSGPPEASEDALERCEVEELQAALTDAIDRLPESQRSVLLLWRRCDEDCQEVAQIRGVTTQAVRRTIARALAAIRDGPCGPRLARLLGGRCALFREQGRGLSAARIELP